MTNESIDDREYKLISIKAYLVLALFIVFLFFATNNLSAINQIDLEQDSNGWTVFTPSDDTRILYVSTETGNDSDASYYTADSVEVGDDPFDPSAAIKPFKTYEAASVYIRDGYPDWILFKRGESFKTQLEPVSGKDSNEFALLGAYGSTGELPQIIIPDSDTIGIYLKVRNGNEVKNTAVVNLDFYAEYREPDSANYTDSTDAWGMFIYATDTGSEAGLISNLLIEGCKFRYFTINEIQAIDDGVITDITIRRSHFLDNYGEDGFSQGLYAYNIAIILEENIFAHNGWYTQSGGVIGPGSMYNHHTYFSDCHDVIFQNNIFIQASCMSNKFTANSGEASTSDVIIENNLYIDGEIGIGMNGNYSTPYKFNNIEISGNVMTNLGDSMPTLRGLFWGIWVDDWDDGEISANYILNNENTEVTNTWGISVEGGTRNLSISDNVIYNLSSVDFKVDDDEDASYRENINISDNIFQEPNYNSYSVSIVNTFGVNLENNIYYNSANSTETTAVGNVKCSFDEWQELTNDSSSTFEEYSFPDSTRDIDTYQEYIGETATIDAFIQACREQNRYEWDSRYNTLDVILWIKKGYNANATNSNDKIIVDKPKKLRIIF